jgi:DNA polymerase III epsilon subunit family exonuclease
LFFALLIVATPVIISAAIWLAYQAGDDQTSRLVPVYVGFGVIVLMLLILLVWQLFDRHVAAALQTLAREMQTTVHTDGRCAPRTEPLQYLGPIGPAVNELTTTLHALREREHQNLDQSTAVVEARFLASLLHELETAVLVMNLSHEILLYNCKALSMLCVTGYSHHTGNTSGTADYAVPKLARSVSEFIRGSTLEFAVKHLLDSEQSDTSRFRLIISPARVDGSFSGTVRLLNGQDGKAVGYVLVFDAISGIGEWPMANYLSSDLVDNAIAALDPARASRVYRKPSDPTASECRWLVGNIYLLERLTTSLLKHVCDMSNERGVLVTTRILKDVLELSLSWRGDILDSEFADRLLDSGELIESIGLTGRQILELHGTGIDYRSDAPKEANSLIMTLRANPDYKESDVEGRTFSDALPSPSSAQSSLRPGTLDRHEFYDLGLFSRRLAPDVEQWVLADTDFVVFDTETTGLNPSGGDEIISIGAVRMVNGRVLQTECFHELINPGRSIPKRSIEFHGITDDMVLDKPSVIEVLPRFAEFAGSSVLVAHNAAFDMRFIELKSSACGITIKNPVLDTVLLSAWLHDHTQQHTLDDLAQRFGILINDRHSALGDALGTARIFEKLIAQLAARDVNTLQQAMAVSNQMKKIRRQQKAY